MNRPIRLIVLLVALAAVSLSPSDGWGQAKPKVPFATVAMKYFSTFDKDKNGELSPEELDRILTDPTIKGEPAAVAAVLRQTGTPPKKTDPVPTVNKDFLMSPPPFGKASFESRYSGAMTRITQADRRLFVGGGPKLDTIHQGGMGDCFALAPLGAYLNREPKDVSKMFEQLRSGKIKVSFADKAVEVSPLTDGEFAMSGGSTENSGCWVRIYEKALGTYRLEKTNPENKKSLATDLIAHGGSIGSVLTTLTGHTVNSFSCVKFREADTEDKKKGMLDELRSRLNHAISENRLICLGTPMEVSVPGVSPKHAYAILSYDATADVLTIWNPHGNEFKPKGPEGLENGYAKKDGLFKAPLKEAVQWAGAIVFETRTAPKK